MKRKRNKNKNQNIYFITLSNLQYQENINVECLRVICRTFILAKVDQKKSMYQQETNSIALDLKLKTCKYSGKKFLNALKKFQQIFNKILTKF